MVAVIFRNLTHGLLLAPVTGVAEPKQLSVIGSLCFQHRREKV
jgi:hypothetical protein